MNTKQTGNLEQLLTASIHGAFCACNKTDANKNIEIHSTGRTMKGHLITVLDFLHNNEASIIYLHPSLYLSYLTLKVQICMSDLTGIMKCMPC